MLSPGNHTRTVISEKNHKKEHPHIKHSLTQNKSTTGEYTITRE
jgi:hypothetical protein